MSGAANAARGEVSLRLGGRDHVLRPTFAHLAATEAMAGCGLLVLARRFLDGTYGLGDVVAVLAPPFELPAGEVGRLVLAAGVLSVAPACGALLAMALKPGGEVPNPLA